MQLFKWCGALALLTVGAALGYLLSRFEEKRYRQACGFFALIERVRMQIECFATPTEQILAALEPDTRAACGLPDKKGDLGTLLAETVLLVPSAIAELMGAFATDLGGSYREEQLRCCEYYLSRLGPLCEALRTELPARRKLSWLLPLTLAASLVLMLI